MPPDESQWTVAHLQEVIEMFERVALEDSGVSLVRNANFKAADATEGSFEFGFNRPGLNITQVQYG